MKGKYMFTGILVGLFVACQIMPPETVIIKGAITNSKITRVYLTDAHYWEKLLDSAEVRNDSFTIKLKKNKLFLRDYSIGYFDENGRHRSIKFKNHILSTDSVKYYINGFLIDSSIVTISAEKGNNEYYEIKAGYENEAYLSTQMMSFGILDGDLAKRTSLLNLYMATLKKYPSSKFLLSQLIENKSTLTKSQMRLLLNEFDKSILKGGSGVALQTYLDKKVDTPTYKNFTLMDNKSNKVKMLNPNAKLQMLVFWASWCSPCIKEIPDIVKLNELYKSRGLLVTSISIDNEIDKWEVALKQNKMNWLQLIVPSELNKDFASEYEIGTIPYILFLDSSGKLVDKFVGYDNNNFEFYRKTIESRLK